MGDFIVKVDSENLDYEHIMGLHLHSFVAKRHDDRRIVLSSSTSVEPRSHRHQPKVEKLSDVQNKRSADIASAIIFSAKSGCVSLESRQKDIRIKLSTG